MLHARFARDPEIRKRFQREGYAANKIEHPGAVAILDDDTAEDGVPYLVMELLEGESLSGWLSRIGGRLPVADVLAIAGQVAEVLIAAHEAHVVHRDIKPANIFVTKGGSWARRGTWRPSRRAARPTRSTTAPTSSRSAPSCSARSPVAACTRRPRPSTRPWRR
jgi:serine/threonine protein kinase